MGASPLHGFIIVSLRTNQIYIKIDIQIYIKMIFANF